MNHCDEVLCTVCGLWWCQRGCEGGQLTPEEVRDYLKRMAGTPCGVYYYKDIQHCGQYSVVGY